VSDAKPVVQYVVLFGRFVVRGTLIQLHPRNEQDESLVSKVVCESRCLCKKFQLFCQGPTYWRLLQCGVM
jgi:hypothetical protein